MHTEHVQISACNECNTFIILFCGKLEYGLTVGASLSPYLHGLAKDLKFAETPVQRL